MADSRSRTTDLTREAEFLRTQVRDLLWERELLLGLSQRVTTLGGVLKEAIELARARVDAQCGFIALLSASQTELLVKAHSDGGSVGQQPELIPFGENYLWEAIQSKQPKTIVDAPNDRRFVLLSCERRPIHNSMAVPLIGGQSVVGLLVLHNKMPRGSGNFVEDDLRAGQVFGAYVTLSIENAAMTERFQHLAMYEDMTDLVRRDRAPQITNEMLQNVNGRWAHCAIVDLDRFKEVNDTPGYGHEKGNQLIIQVAQALKEFCVNEDPGIISCHWGGDEFLFCFVSQRRGDCNSFAEGLWRCANDVLAQDPEIRALNLTASVGGYTLLKDHASYDKLVSGADKALYDAKDLGRNRSHVIIAEEHSEV